LGHSLQGRLPLSSKPTWATKNAPDVYLAGYPDDYTLPNVSVSAGSSQTGLAHASTIKVALTDEVFDDENIFDNATNYRFQPTKSGKYLITWAVQISTDSATGFYRIRSELHKNGSREKRGAFLRSESSSSDLCDVFTSTGSAIVEFNGTTDYAELYAYAAVTNGTGTWTIAGSGADDSLTYFTATLILTQEDLNNAIVGFSLAQNGKAGLIEYEYDELDISSSGDFDPSQPLLRIARVGSVVTLTWDNITHSTTSAPESAAGFIPSEYLPEATVRTTVNFGANAVILAYVDTSGKLIFSLRDWSGSPYSGTGVNGGSISWVIDE
jgi:hypothetical protein